jgi:hypothetical protein
MFEERPWAYLINICESVITYRHMYIIELTHPLDGITNSTYKLLCYLTTFFCKEKKALAGTKKALAFN